MQPESELQSNFGSLEEHYQRRRPAHDGIAVGEVSEHTSHSTLLW